MSTKRKAEEAFEEALRKHQVAKISKTTSGPLSKSKFNPPVQGEFSVEHLDTLFVSNAPSGSSSRAFPEPQPQPGARRQRKGDGAAVKNGPLPSTKTTNQPTVASSGTNYSRRRDLIRDTLIMKDDESIISLGPPDSDEDDEAGTSSSEGSSNRAAFRGLADDRIEAIRSSSSFGMMRQGAASYDNPVCISKEDKIVFANKSWLDAFEFSSLSQAHGKSFKCLQGLLTSKEEAGKLAERCRKKVPYFGCLLNYSCKGTPVVNGIKITPLRDSHFLITSSVVQLTDDVDTRLGSGDSAMVSDMGYFSFKESEKERSLFVLVKNLIEETSDPVCVLHHDRTVALNDAWAQAYGVRPDDVLGEPFTVYKNHCLTPIPIRALSAHIRSRNKCRFPITIYSEGSSLAKQFSRVMATYPFAKCFTIVTGGIRSKGPTASPYSICGESMAMDRLVRDSLQSSVPVKNTRINSAEIMVNMALDSRGAVCVFQNSNIVQANEHFLHMFGAQKKDVLGKSFLCLTGSLTEASAVKYAMDSMACRASFTVQLTCHRLDDNCPMLHECSMRHVGNGLYLHSVTKGERLVNMHGSSQCCMLTQHGKIVDVNSAWLRTYSYKRGEVVGRSPDIISGQKTNDAAIQRLSTTGNFERTGRVGFAVRSFSYTKFGEQLITTTSAVPFGKSFYLALSECACAAPPPSPELPHLPCALQNSAVVAVLPFAVKNQHGFGFLSCSPSFCELVGKSPGELQRMKVMDLFQRSEDIFDSNAIEKQLLRLLGSRNESDGISASCIGKLKTRLADVAVGVHLKTYKHMDGGGQCPVCVALLTIRDDRAFRKYLNRYAPDSNYLTLGAGESPVSSRTPHVSSLFFHDAAMPPRANAYRSLLGSSSAIKTCLYSLEELHDICIAYCKSKGFRYTSSRSAIDRNGFREYVVEASVSLTDFGVTSTHIIGLKIISVFDGPVHVWLCNTENASMHFVRECFVGLKAALETVGATPSQ